MIKSTEIYVPEVDTWKFWAQSTQNYMPLLAAMTVDGNYDVFELCHAVYGTTHKIFIQKLLIIHSMLDELKHFTSLCIYV